MHYSGKNKRATISQKPIFSSFMMQCFPHVLCFVFRWFCYFSFHFLSFRVSKDFYMPAIQWLAPVGEKAFTPIIVYLQANLQLHLRMQQSIGCHSSSPMNTEVTATTAALLTTSKAIYPKCSKAPCLTLHELEVVLLFSFASHPEAPYVHTYTYISFIHRRWLIQHS